jgi:hypothetical protein
VPYKKSRTAVIELRNISVLPLITKKAKTKSLFVSRSSLDVTSEDLQEDLEEQVKASSFLCTKLKTKVNTSTSFYISVKEDDFPSINNTRV